MYSSDKKKIGKIIRISLSGSNGGKTALNETGYKILQSALENNIINQDLLDELNKLFELRNNYVHGVSKDNPNNRKRTRPQIKDPIKHAFVWTQNYGEELEKDTQLAIKILFRTWNELHYSKLNYYK